MARVSTLGANAALNGINGTGSTNYMSHVSLHTGDPGNNGASENAATGGYARQTCTWNAAASSAKTNVSALSFTTAGTVAVTHIGTWDALSSGNYGIGAALGSAVTAVNITIAAGAISLTAS